jgi:outer membrane protein
MKRGIYALLVLALVSCQQDKIGFVDNVKLMDGYQEKIDVENKFKSKAEVMGKKRDSISQAFQLEYQELQSKAQNWSQKKAQEELGLLQQKSQFLGQQIQQEEQQLQSEGQTEMDSVVSKVKKEIESYGKANGYTFILGGGEGGSVLYGMETKDLTEEVLKLLNDKYKK